MGLAPARKRAHAVSHGVRASNVRAALPSISTGMVSIGGDRITCPCTPSNCPALARSNRTPSRAIRSEEHTSELQSLMRISYAVFCLKKKKQHTQQGITDHNNQL